MAVEAMALRADSKPDWDDDASAFIQGTARAR